MFTNDIKIKDVAKAANVSTATVSMVLNNKPGISEATRQRILQITQSMINATQNQFIINADTAKTIRFLKIVNHGHVLNSEHNVFIASYLDGLEDEARAKGYNLEVTRLETTDSKAVKTSLNLGNFQGLIVLGTELTEADMSVFKTFTFPMVFIDTAYEHLPFNFVDMNNTEAAYQIAEYFKDHGHIEIGLIQSVAETRNFRLRERAFLEALQYYKIPINQNYILQVDSTFDAACQNMTQILKKGTPLPTAFFASNDIIAYGCIKALKESGRRVPEDISVIGFDDLPLSAVMEPQLTTIKISKKQIGRTAMKLLLEKIESNSSATSKIVVSGELVVRNSVINRREA